MKKIFFVLMAVGAILTAGCIGCNPVDNNPEPPTNDRNHNTFLDDTNGANQPNQVPMRVRYGQDPYYWSDIVN